MKNLKGIFGVTASLLFLMLPLSASALTSGPNNPGSAINNTGIGSVSWSSPSDVTTSNNNDAYASLSKSEISNYLKITNFSFSIPSNATVTGIKVDVEKARSNNDSIVTDASIRVVTNKSGAAATSTDNKATATTWPDSDSVTTYGGSSDTWGSSWTPAQINDSSFGVIVAAQRPNSGSNGSRSARIDNVQITITYTIPADTTAPGIDSHSDVTAEATSNSGATVTYTSPATSDNVDPAGVATCLPASGTTFALGTTQVTCNATDVAGNPATPTTFNVVVEDTTKPAITLLGSSPQTILVGHTYTELGATVLDNYDIGLSVTIDTSAVDTNTVGSYSVHYNITDSHGNVAVTITRTVNVVDQEAPVITLTGANPQTIEIGTTYTELGATVSDNVDSGLSATIDSSTVNTSALGSYTVTYDAQDGSGNHATQVTRTVNVVDTTDPVVTLNGDSDVTLTVGDAYTELGATALDAVDGSLSVTVSGDVVDTATVGTYTVVYSATDNSSNTGSASRTVHVVAVVQSNTTPVVPPIPGGHRRPVGGQVLGAFTDIFSSTDTTNGTTTLTINIPDSIDPNILRNLASVFSSLSSLFQQQIAILQALSRH